MGLRESRIINQVNPWFGARLRWLGEVAALYGGHQSLLSGNRTRSEQLRLYNDPSIAVVAFPGCSQHQYGFAADAAWSPLVAITSKGRPIFTSPQETARIMNNAARHASLNVVAGDTGHLQVFNGLQFKSWAVSRGFCNPNPPARNFPESFPLVGGIIDRFCGTGFTSVQIREGVVTCGPISQITSLIGE